ncbi:MAG: hypothetical protein ACFFAY_13955 [Promethearchaeota archaeon]
MKDSTYTKEREKVPALVERLVREMKLPEGVSQEANRILEQAQELEVAPGQNPGGQAAAAVYIASILTDNRVTQEAVSQTFEVSIQTVRTHYIKLVRALGISRGSR